MSYPTGGPPEALAAGDLDDDGDLDLATANSTSQDVSVLLNRGDGSYEPSVIYPLAHSGRYIDAVDANDDGRLDLLITQQPEAGILPFHVNASVLVNRGDGRFPSRFDIPFPPLQSRVVALVEEPDGSRFYMARTDEGFLQLPADFARDCNGNGTPDGCDIATSVSLDLDENGVPDECETILFVRGDCNGDGRITGVVTDAIFLLTFNFLGGTPPPCAAACDADADGEWSGTVTDAVFLLSFSFLGGPPPPPPFPECGAGAAGDTRLGCTRQPTPCAGSG